MLLRCEFEPEHLMQGGDRVGSATIRGWSDFKVRGSVIVGIILCRNCKEAASNLTAEQWGAVKIHDAADVAKGMTVGFVEPRSFISVFEAVDADDTHFGVGSRNLAIGRAARRSREGRWCR